MSQPQMAVPANAWLTAFALLGLAASSASTWVHYRILNDPTYASFCDVNATLSCTEAYTSRFGAFAGVPVALFGVLFFAFVLASDRAVLAHRGRVARTCPVMCSLRRRSVWPPCCISAYASYFILNVVCLLCVGTYVAVIGLFLISGASTRYPMTNLPMRILDDLKLLVRTPRALTAAVVFVVAAAAAIVMFPEQPVTAAASDARRAEQAQPAAGT